MGATGWSAEFLHDEWSQVVLGHAINSREEYFRVRRAGRGRTLSRPQRAEVWQLIEQYTKRLADAGLWTFRQVAARAARLEAERARAKGARYRHVVVDEAQDLSPAHWMLLRAMVAPGRNDCAPRTRSAMSGSSGRPAPCCSSRPPGPGTRW